MLLKILNIKHTLLKYSFFKFKESESHFICLNYIFIYFIIFVIYEIMRPLK